MKLNDLFILLSTLLFTLFSTFEFLNPRNIEKSTSLFQIKFSIEKTMLPSTPLIALKHPSDFNSKKEKIRYFNFIT